MSRSNNWGKRTRMTRSLDSVASRTNTWSIKHQAVSGMGELATGTHRVSVQGHQKIIAVCLQSDAVIVIPVLPGEEVDRDDLARSGSDQSLLVASNLPRFQEGERHSDLEPTDFLSDSGRLSLVQSDQLPETPGPVLEQNGIARRLDGTKYPSAGCR